MTILIGVLLVLCAMSYAPFFSSVSTGVVGGTLNKYIHLLTIVLLVLSFRVKDVISCKFFMVYVVVLFIVLLEGLLFLGVGAGNSFLKEIQEIGLPLCVTIIAYCSRIKEKDLLVISIVYMVVLAVVSTILIISNIGAFKIEDTYLVKSKNGLGGMLLISVISSLIYVSSIGKNKTVKILLLFIAGYSFFCCLTMRARGATIFTIILVFVLLYKLKAENNNSYRIIKRILLLVIPLMVVFLLATKSFSNIVDYFINSISAGADDDFTSGRIERNKEALNIIGESPLFGLLTLPYTLPWVHNYLLMKISSYGIVGGAPLILLYGYLLCFVLNKIFKEKATMESKLGYWALLGLFFLSVSEPTPPYTPGTTVVFAYILLGCSLRKSQESLC